MKVLITGIGATGKSSIVKALNERGIFSVDLHDVSDLMFYQDKVTKERVEYSPMHSKGWWDGVDRICDIEKLKELINNQENIIVAGTAGDNQTEYFPLFDKIILLQCSPETILHRMKTRINKSGYGKSADEQEDNIQWQKEFDPEVLSYGAIPISTEGDIEYTVNKILKETS